VAAVVTGMMKDFIFQTSAEFPYLEFYILIYFQPPVVLHSYPIVLLSVSKIYLLLLLFSNSG
jgi:hypothetical protein